MIEHRIQMLDGEVCIPFRPHLSKRLGSEGATLIVQQIHYFTTGGRGNLEEGYVWVYNSVTQWQENHFFWMSPRKVERLLRQLEQDGILITDTFNKFKGDRTKWYRLDYNHPVFEDEVVSVESLYTKKRDPSRQSDGKGGTHPVKVTEPSRQNGVTNTIDFSIDSKGKSKGNEKVSERADAPSVLNDKVIELKDGRLTGDLALLWKISRSAFSNLPADLNELQAYNKTRGEAISGTWEMLLAEQAEFWQDSAAGRNLFIPLYDFFRIRFAENTEVGRQMALYDIRSWYIRKLFDSDDPRSTDRQTWRKEKKRFNQFFSRFFDKVAVPSDYAQWFINGRVGKSNQQITITYITSVSTLESYIKWMEVQHA
jgi:hypothetical protein